MNKILILVTASLLWAGWATAAHAANLTLNWTDNADNETGFKVERCQGVACSPTVQILTAPANPGTGAASAVDGGLAENATYCYRLRATNSAGDSAYSNTACGTTVVTIPSAPTSLGVAP